jgi:hypothetical protein
MAMKIFFFFLSNDCVAGRLGLGKLDRTGVARGICLVYDLRGRSKGKHGIGVWDMGVLNIRRYRQCVGVNTKQGVK